MKKIIIILVLLPLALNAMDPSKTFGWYQMIKEEKNRKRDVFNHIDKFTSDPVQGDENEEHFPQPMETRKRKDQKGSQTHRDKRNKLEPEKIGPVKTKSVPESQYWH